MNIVFFVKKGPPSAEFLKQITLKKIPINYIFIEKSKSKDIFKRIKTSIKRYGIKGFINIINGKVFTRFSLKASKEWEQNDFYYSFSDNIIIVNDLNGNESEKKLIEIKPDLIILGATGVIRDNIIRIPKFGILNAHPGLLPMYRGVDVIPWAILNGDDIGVTVHFIDEGIDTGKIIFQKKIPIESGDTFESLKEKADKLNGQLYAKAILTIMENGKIKTIENPKEKGKQYYRMDRILLKEATEKLNEKISKECK